MEAWTSMDPGSSSKSYCGQKRTGLQNLSPKHKIFLSHSGAQKEFVRQLCKDLEVETHQPFFDERSSSLIMGEQFAPLLFKATRQCVVAVIVLSEDFLTSTWPMLELVEFVRAKKFDNPNLKLLPLFYKLSLEDLKDKSKLKEWEATWAQIITQLPNELLPPNDTYRQLNLISCREALCELRGANGLKFEMFASEVAYREAIVKEISLLVAPNLLDDTSDVIGNERLCKVIDEMFVEDTEEDSNLQGTYKLGLYGMGGLGKTLMSRAISMFFHPHFNGRVFHVELGSRPPLDLQKLVLTKLLRIDHDLVERVHTIHEGRKLLKDHMNRQPVFLVIDNITNDRQSHMEALAYLEAGFHSGSMIMITSRSLDVVEELFPSHPHATYCKAMTSLSEEEALFIFLQRAAPQRKLDTFTLEEQEILDVCLSQCHFLLDNGEGQYHPLALQALADYYHKYDKLNMLKWKGHLGDLDKWRLSNASSNIFGILGLQFTTLEFKEKLIFLDLCLYIDPNFLFEYSSEGLKWLVDIHEDTPAAIEFQVQRLKRSGIINITFNKDGDQFITIHDLYKEFAKWYVVDGEGSRCAEHGCVYHTISTDSLPYVLKRTSPSSFRLQRIRLENLTCSKFPSMKVQEWCNVVVLEIYKCSNLKKLQLHGLSCLRHLELVGLPNLESFDLANLQLHTKKRSIGTLKSLQYVVLRDLQSLKRLPNFSLCTSLKRFELFGGEEFLPKPPQFMGCSHLEALTLHWNLKWRFEDLKLNTLTSLTSLILHGFRVRITYQHNNTDFTVTGFGNCSQLQELKLYSLPISSLVGLEKLTELIDLEVMFCSPLQCIPDVSTLAKLRILHIDGGLFQQVHGLERLLQLRKLRFMKCSNLTSLPNLDNLLELELVDLFRSTSLKVLPRVPMGCRLVS